VGGIVFTGKMKLDQEELNRIIVEKPTYDSSKRKKTKLTPEIIRRIEHYIQENQHKRATGKAKQQKKKIDIYDALIEEGFDISYPTICNTVRAMEQTRREAFIKQQYSLGEACEFDWGEVKLTIAGKDITLQLSLFVSAKGDYRYADLFHNQKTESFLEAHASFFEHLHGAYNLMVYDNTKVAVKRFVGHSQKEPTEALLKLSLYYGFNFRFCNTYAGWEKGHVERGVEYIRRKAFSHRDEFESLEEARAYLHEVCERLNRLSQAAREHKSARDILEEERPHLLPYMPRYDTARTTEARVDKYSTVCIDNCHYSVPDLYVGEFLFIKIYTSKILCYYKGQKIAEHKRNYGFKKWSIQLEHYLRTLKKKPGALAGSVALKQAEPELQKIYRYHYTGKEKEFIHLIELIGEKGWSKVEKALDALKKVSPNDISTEKVKTLCNRSDDITGIKFKGDTEIRSKDALRAYSRLFNASEQQFEKGVAIL
jgi:transposase